MAKIHMNGAHWTLRSVIRTLVCLGRLGDGFSIGVYVSSAFTRTSGPLMRPIVIIIIIVVVVMGTYYI